MGIMQLSTPLTVVSPKTLPRRWTSRKVSILHWREECQMTRWQELRPPKLRVVHSNTEVDLKKFPKKSKSIRNPSRERRNFFSKNEFLEVAINFFLRVAAGTLCSGRGGYFDNIFWVNQFCDFLSEQPAKTYPKDIVGLIMVHYYFTNILWVN